MTQEEFIEVLTKKRYAYRIEGDNIVVTREGNVDLDILETLPPVVEFNNGGFVSLGSLKTLPPGVEFNNGEFVNLWSLKTLPSGVEFKNGGNVNLDALKTFPPGVKFNNGGDINLNSLFGGWFSRWDGNIEGIVSKRLLNLMIKREMFI